MLSPEAAAKQLEQWQIQSEDGSYDIEAKLVELAGQLPKQGRSLAYCLYDRDDNGKEFESADSSDAHKRKIDAFEEFDGWTSVQRSKWFAHFLPKLAEDLEQTWQYLKSTPYMVGYARRSFRTPKHAGHTVSKRTDWLKRILGIAVRYRSDVVTAPWLATWAAHLKENWRNWQDEIGQLLASVLNAGGPKADEVFSILSDSLCNQHEIGAMGRHVSRALLLSPRADGWELMEKTLLAAQRQEGLRQVILETVDEAHPEAFRRMLRLIQEHDLVRFSAVARAVDVWFGFAWDSQSTKTINDIIGRCRDLLEDYATCQKAVSGKSADDAYLGLWAMAFEDAQAAIAAASPLLRNKDVEFRFAATCLLTQTDLPEAEELLAGLLDDADIRVAWCAFIALNFTAEGPVKGAFERLERLHDRLPEKPVATKPLVWPWTAFLPERGQVTRMMLDALGDRPPTRLLPYLKSLPTYYRARVIELLSKQKKWDSLTRTTILDLVGDAAMAVREAAMDAMANQTLRDGDAQRLEGYLTRKSADLRRGVIRLLAGQKDQDSLAGANRLLAAKDAQQRLAGLELLRQLGEAGRQIEQCQRRAEEYRTKQKKLTKEEETQLAAIAGAGREKITLENALGLINPVQRTAAAAPRNRKIQFITNAAVNLLKDLDKLIHDNRELNVTCELYNNERKEMLLGEVQYGFPLPKRDRSREENILRCPHRDTWQQWFDNRKKECRDTDGLELTRAIAWAGVERGKVFGWDTWLEKCPDHQKVAEFVSSGKPFVALRYPTVAVSVLQWLFYFNPPPRAAEFLLDAVESSFSLTPPKWNEQLVELAANTEQSCYDAERSKTDWRAKEALEFWFDELQGFVDLDPSTSTEKERARFWQLAHWRDEPVPGAKRERPHYSLLMDAYATGVASDADWYDELLGPRTIERWSSCTFDALSRLTQRKLRREDARLLERRPEVAQIVEHCRKRILEIELARGEEATAATRPAHDLESIHGADLLLQILASLGKAPFKIYPPFGETHHRFSRVPTLTHLVRIAYPKEDDTPTDFAKKLRTATEAGLIPEERILELAFHSPQWCRHVEAYLGWTGFCEALYWFLAHMKYIGSIGEQAAVGAGEETTTTEGENEESAQSQSSWHRLVAERTPLTNRERQEGAVDIAWFQKIYAQLTPKRWEAMAKAARYASSPAMAKRAQFVADVLLGKASRKELIEGIRKKFLKENVRLLGLLPLAKGDKRDKDVAERYKVLVEYRKYAKQLSAMSKEDAVRAAEVGFQNLARTAGYTDPLRLEWAMEAESVKDLAKGSVEAARDGVTVRLVLDESSRPTLSVCRGEKELKSIPPEIKKKDKAIAALAERVPELNRQSSRMRQSLEAAMCRGDVITPAELVQLCDHALLRPMLSRLVLVGDGILGYPDKGGKALRNAAGKLEPIKKSESLRIAHPHDLFASGDWDAWQRDCFQAERVQPFKQIFRELYVVTKQEKSDGTLSRRYAGQQVNPSQATALWGQRGWSTKDGVWKTFYDVGITVSVGFNYGITTPLEVEGWTIETVQFTQRDSYERLKLTAVPPRIFSEVMRDLDLVVSVAHRGQVDPEASASTVEMRANLLDETCRLLQLKNVRIKNQHALVDGELGKYSIHLGSAVVHKMPGGSLCIVPVHAQHRGRLFLPFADDDPKTAEVISKVLLLARDAEIQDPIILDQLRHVGV